MKKLDQKGVAILLAIFVMVIITYLVTEVTYETNVEYLVNSQSIHRLKAYYAARSGIELSLLRVQIYQKLKTQYGKMLGPQAKMLDLIWTFPLTWPPTLPSEASGVDKDMLETSLKESIMDSQFTMQISDEGSKIDLNDLGSPIIKLRDLTKKQILGLFENAEQNDPDFRKKFPDLKAEELVNNIADWVDDDKQSLNGGAEAQYYSEFESDKLPPNRAFRTMDELKMIPGMTDDVFEFLKPAITIYGARAINPNYASPEVLKSIDPTFTTKVVTEITARRSDPKKGGPFINKQDFWNFATQAGARVDTAVQDALPLVFDSVYNFRIKSIGLYKNSTREIEVITYDLSSAAKVMFAAMPTPIPQPGTTTTTTVAPIPTQNNVPKGAPRIVYWREL